MAAAVPANGEWGIIRNWRVTYYACGLIVVCLIKLDAVSGGRQPDFRPALLLFLCGWYGGKFVLCMIRTRGSRLLSPSELGRRWAITVFDRSILSLTVPLFFACFALVKASILILRATELILTWAKQTAS